MGLWWDYFKAFVVICLLVFAAYYVTKVTAKASGGKFRRSSDIKLSGTLPLGKDKSVSIVRIGEYAYILGVGTQRVEMLDKIPLSELSLTQEECPEPKLSELFKRETAPRESGFGDADFDTGLKGFLRRFKAEFRASLKRQLSRAKTPEYPDNIDIMKTAARPGTDRDFAEILKKQSLEKEQQ